MTDPHRYCVVIPVFNGAQTIGDLVQRVKEQGLPVIVVDDGSQDRTAAVASDRGALVISHLQNEGKGRALRTGFEYAVRHRYDGVITMDGDGQHDPEDIPRLIREGEVQHAGIVLGNRMNNGAVMPRRRRWANHLMSQIISLVARQTIPDSQCGFRVVRREVLENVPLRSTRFEIESELVLRAAAKRWKIISVSVKTIYDARHRSHIRPVREGLRFLWLLMRHAVGQ